MNFISTETLDAALDSRSVMEELLCRIIASADECDVPEGGGVPMVLIDARLIEKARELMK
jgi:hypothetical protein